MATPIQNKVNYLLSQQVALGAPVTAEIDAGYGGKMQEFSGYTIYYHPVMGAEAKEVHGAIRTKYKELGAHGVRPKSTTRLFGFPLSDETATPTHSCRVSYFETGAIYFSNGAVAITGDFYTEYKRRGAEASGLGLPVSDLITISDGSVMFFEFGCLYRGTRSQNAFLEILYRFPQLGQPWLIRGSELGLKDVVSWRHAFILNYNLAGHLLDEIFKGRLFLKETGGTVEHGLTINPLTATATTISTNVTEVKGKLQFVGTAPTLVNRRLYDIVLKFPTGTFGLAMHSVYIRETWTDFKFVHATDAHVSRRVDGFRQFFRSRGMAPAVQYLNNPNDRFREFIRWANGMWRQGKLDFIFITGDLVDYIWEDDRKYKGHNNFVFFEELLLGKTGQPDLVPNEELLVPIFTSLGNHDYRLMPYYPLFTVDLLGPDMEMEQYGQFNLSKEEARILTQGYLNVTGTVSSDAAVKMTTPDRKNAGGNLTYYFSRINRDATYMVPVGPKHSLVMIDGRWDDGVIEGTADGLSYALGFKGEATDNFVGGSPDSVGFVAEDYTLVRAAMARQGLCMVGVHAPVINPKYSHYTYFLREQMRTSHPTPYAAEVSRWLFHKSPAAFMQTSTTLNQTYNLAINAFPDYPRTNTAHFNESTGGNFLDYGVMRGGQAEFLKYCTGILPGTRPLDAVFSGHVHKNWESRVKANTTNGKFKFHHDFYTHNPAKYYNSIIHEVPTAAPFNLPIGTVDGYLKSVRKEVRVNVDPTATNNEVPTLGTNNVWTIKTKPFANTLNGQSGAAACTTWWNNMKPLLIQTASLGQGEWGRGDLPQPDFKGCRYIEVAADVIQKIYYVTTADITAALVAPGGGTGPILGGIGGIG